MKKYKKVISITVVILIVVASFLLGKFSNTENEYLEDKPKEVKQENTLSMMIEQTAGTGDYKLETRTSWPTDGYMFNETLSKCENGGILGWDSEKGVVTMTGNMSDKCYVYFDIYVELPYHQSCNDNTLACYVAKKYTGTQGENSIYYHDSSLTNGAGDNSYRYAGASSTVNNYVCFGSDADTCPTDNLYRIIGVFNQTEDNKTVAQVKLIKYDYATTTQLGTGGDYYDTYGSWCSSGCGTTKGSNALTSIGVYYWNYKATGSATNTWSTSLLNKTNLNTNYITYLNNINTKWAKMIATTTWKVGGNTYANIASVVAKTAYQNEITSPTPTSTSTTGETEYTARIGLMYVSDYGFAASSSAWPTALSSYNSSSITSVNWMYMGLYEWTISRRADDSGFAFYVYSGGYVGYNYVGGSFAVRPVFFLKSIATYSNGAGTSTSPYRIN